MISSLYLDVPHMNPKLEIVCPYERILAYIYHAFSPYVFKEVSDSERYERIEFITQSDRIIVRHLSGEEVLAEDILPYLQKYLLYNTYSDDGFLMLHGACVAKDNQAHVFLADSMVGKSTLVSYLCMRGYEYVTDDRVLINASELKVTPFTKKIMLRPEGKELLINEYDCNLTTHPLVVGGKRKELFEPQQLAKNELKISSIYFLNRIDGGKMSFRVIKGQEKVIRLIKYSLSIPDCKKIQRFVALSCVTAMEVTYSDMSELEKFICMNITCR